MEAQKKLDWLWKGFWMCFGLAFVSFLTIGQIGMWATILQIFFLCCCFICMYFGAVKGVKEDSPTN